MKLVALADVSKEFDNQLHRINQVRWKGDNLDFDLVMTDSSLCTSAILSRFLKKALTGCLQIKPM